MRYLRASSGKVNTHNRLTFALHVPILDPNYN